MVQSGHHSGPGRALLARHVRGIRAGVTEPLPASPALKGLLPRVDSRVLFEVVFEFEGFGALRAFKLAQLAAVTVADQMPLQAVHVGEQLAALRTRFGVGPEAARSGLQHRRDHPTVLTACRLEHFAAVVLRGRADLTCTRKRRPCLSAVLARGINGSFY